MAKPTAGCTVSHGLYGLYCSQSPSECQRDKQSHLPCLGINTAGQKELLEMWLAENEGTKLWLNVLTELKNRGL